MASIAIYGLNRVELVQARTLGLNDLAVQKGDILDDLEIASSTTDEATALRLQTRALEKMERFRVRAQADKEFSMMAETFLNDFEAELAELAQ